MFGEPYLWLSKTITDRENECPGSGVELGPRAQVSNHVI